MEQVSHEIGNIFDLAYKLFHVIDDNNLIYIELFDNEYVPDSRTLFDMLSELTILGIKLRYGTDDNSVDYTQINRDILAHYPELSPDILRKFNKRVDLDSISYADFHFISSRMRQMQINIELEIADKSDTSNITYQKLVAAGYNINDVAINSYLMARDYSDNDILDQHVLRLVTVNNIFNISFAIIKTSSA
jgi:hypothetical protein